MPKKRRQRSTIESKEQREAIIDIIITYRDEIRTGNRQYYNELIEIIQNCPYEALDGYKKLVDMWIDS